jgi:hypothetical protein
MAPPRQAFKADNPPRFQVNYRLIIRLNFMPSDCRSQVLFQKRPLADMRIHHWIEEAVLGPFVSGASECDVGASEQLIDSHLPSSGLSNTHVCPDAQMLYADLDGFLHVLDERKKRFYWRFRDPHVPTTRQIRRRQFVRTGYRGQFGLVTAWPPARAQHRIQGAHTRHAAS